MKNGFRRLSACLLQPEPPAIQAGGGYALLATGIPMAISAAFSA